MSRCNPGGHGGEDADRQMVSNGMETWNEEQGMKGNCKQCKRYVKGSGSQQVPEHQRRDLITAAYVPYQGTWTLSYKLWEIQKKCNVTTRSGILEKLTLVSRMELGGWTIWKKMRPVRQYCSYTGSESQGVKREDVGKADGSERC